MKNLYIKTSACLYMTVFLKYVNLYCRSVANQNTLIFFNSHEDSPIEVGVNVCLWLLNCQRCMEPQGSYTMVGEFKYGANAAILLQYCHNRLHKEDQLRQCAHTLARFMIMHAWVYHVKVTKKYQ